jgi:hypothetical protein
MTDLDLPALSAAALAAGAVPGFVVEDLDVRVVGRCTGCAAASESRRERPRRAVTGPEGAERPR